MLNVAPRAAQFGFVSVSSAYTKAGPIDANRSKACWTAGASRSFLS